MKLLRRIEFGGAALFTLMLLLLMLGVRGVLPMGNKTETMLVSLMAVGGGLVLGVAAVFSFWAIRNQVALKGTMYLMVPFAWFVMVACITGITDVLFITGEFSLLRCGAVGISVVLIQYGSGLLYRFHVTADSCDGA